MPRRRKKRVSRSQRIALAREKHKPKKKRRASQPKRKGGFDYHCLPPDVAAEHVEGSRTDSYWIEEAKWNRMWVEAKRPKNKPHEPLQACGVCHKGGRRILSK